MIILSGPLGPKFMADALVVSVKVGDGGPEDTGGRGLIANERRERALGIVANGEDEREEEEREKREKKRKIQVKSNQNMKKNELLSDDGSRRYL